MVAVFWTQVLKPKQLNVSIANNSEDDIYDI